VALAWSYGIHKAPALVGTLVVFLVVVTAFALPSQIQTLGPYASHASSDQFRAVIDQASFLDMRQHFIFGSGAGTATIQLPSGTFYFHNSFEALVAEFGIPGTVLYAIVAISTVTALFTCTRRSPMIEAAFLSLLIMSLTVGEVLFAFTAAVVIGTSWRYVLLERRREVAGMPHEALSVA
jgi:O-antigen ligase